MVCPGAFAAGAPFTCQLGVVAFMATDREPKPPGTIMSTTDNKRSDTGEDATLLRWIPIVPLLALLPTLAAYFIGWGLLAGTH